jgi:hypothetical protein
MEDPDGYDTPALGSAVASAEPSCGGTPLIASTVASAYPSGAGMSATASAPPSAEPSKAEELTTGPSADPAVPEADSTYAFQGHSHTTSHTINRQQQEAIDGAVHGLRLTSLLHKVSDAPVLSIVAAGATSEL